VDTESRQGKRALIVISGLPGTGKSEVAAELAARLKALHLSIDPIEGSSPLTWCIEVGHTA
jgi:Mrp family chromosome partitioning ATPase